MLRTDETALICDFAETYHLTDYRALPPTKAAALAVGLRENSRVKLHMAGQQWPMDTLLLAAIADRLSLLLWLGTKDAERGRNRPASILAQLMGGGSDPTRPTSFDSGEAFEHRRRELLERRESNA